MLSATLWRSARPRKIQGLIDEIYSGPQWNQMSNCSFARAAICVTTVGGGGDLQPGTDAYLRTRNGSGRPCLPSNFRRFEPRIGRAFAPRRLRNIKAKAISDGPNIDQLPSTRPGVIQGVTTTHPSSLLILYGLKCPPADRHRPVQLKKSLPGISL